MSDEVRALQSEQIASCGYAHVPWMKTVQRRFEDEDVPAKRILYELGRELLLNAGYREIELELDHFALETDGLWKAYACGARQN